MSQRPPNTKIQELSSLANVNSEAVFNFLSTLPENTSIADDLANLTMDSVLYGWNYETIKAIQNGILKRF